MSKQEDVEALRRFAGNFTMDNGSLVCGGMIADLVHHAKDNTIARASVATALHAVARLFSSYYESDAGAGSDLAALRRELADVPMSTRQRDDVGCWLDKLQSAMETETPDEGERSAERAIETLSRYLGGIDELWHNYQVAARIGKDACKSMLRIRSTCPTYDTSKGPWADATEQAIAALGSVRRYSDIIKTAERWQADSADDEREGQAAARQTILDMMKAISRALPGGSELRCACCEFTEALDEMLGNNIPF